MLKAEFELEAITPIFMRGADQSKAEIRAASIKGLMRWWFRALAGSYFGSDIIELKRVEEEVFGSTRRRSKVVIEVESPEPKKLHFKPGIIDRKTKVEDLKYLWFSIKLLSKERAGYQFQYYYPPNTKFSIQLRSFSNREFKIALLSLWISVVLGGFGFRSRRGAGSLMFTGGDLDILENLGLISSFKNPDDLGNSIRQVVKLMGEVLGRKAINSTPPYPTLSEKTCCVALWDSGKKDVFGVLKQFEQNYLRFRRNVNKPERVVFGLPINLKGKGVERIKDRLRELKNTRRASPMIVGVLKINEKLFIKIVKFRTSRFHYNDKINEIANWETLAKFDGTIREIVVYGSKSVFEEV